MKHTTAIPLFFGISLGASLGNLPEPFGFYTQGVAVLVAWGLLLHQLRHNP